MALLLQDLRYGVRGLVASPTFTLVAVLALALGIGANTALFTVVDGVLLRPLPYDDPGRLLYLNETHPRIGRFSVAPGNFVSWQEESTVFAGMSVYGGASLVLTGEGEPAELRGAAVSAGLFAMLGMRPLVGREFLPEEDQPDRDDVVILSQALWQTRFGGAADIVGRVLTLSGRPRTVVGVVPRGFEFLRSDVQAWVPMAMSADDRQNHGSHSLRAIGRLREGATVEQARAELDTIAARLEREFPQNNKDWRVEVRPLLDVVVGNSRQALLVLLGAVGFVLLIACANVANMLLARATGRQKEIAIRFALGAGRLQVVRQLLAEAGLLGLAGGGAGLALAAVGLRVLPALAPGMPRLDEVALDPRALAFTGGLAVLTSLVFGFAPAVQMARPDLTGSLKEGGRGASGGAGRRRLRQTLVVAEIALAAVLLIGAGLLIRSFWNLQHVDPGFRQENLIAVSLALASPRYADDGQATAFYGQLVERAAALPGVEAAAVANALPFSSDYVNGFRIQERPEPAPGEWPATNYYAVSPDYFKAMGIPLRRGRLFTDQDREGAPRVVVINEAMARRMFPGEDPIGQHIHVTNGPLVFREIVGIVGDVKQYELDADAPMQTYEPYLQQEFRRMSLVVRTAADPALLGAAVRQAVLAIDPDQPVTRVATLADLVADSVAESRASARLIAVFGALALLLAAVGVYGVMAFTVAQRTHEFAIRIAIGAGTASLLRMVVRQALGLALGGAALGVGAALALTRVTATLLFGVTATDPATFAAVPAVLIGVALLASYVPAWRATVVDPITALRSE